MPRLVIADDCEAAPELGRLRAGQSPLPSLSTNSTGSRRARCGRRGKGWSYNPVGSVRAPSAPTCPGSPTPGWRAALSRPPRMAEEMWASWLGARVLNRGRWALREYWSGAEPSVKKGAVSLQAQARVGLARDATVGSCAWCGSVEDVLDHSPILQTRRPVASAGGVTSSGIECPRDQGMGQGLTC